MRRWLLCSLFIGLIVGLATVGGLITSPLLRPNYDTPSLASWGFSMSEKRPTGTTRTTDKDFGSVLSQYRTKFDFSEQGMMDDLRLVASQLQHVHIAPNSTFSFLEQVPKLFAPSNRSEKTVLVNGRVGKNTSWSACQLASTLFCAALLADLPVLEHTNQSRPVGYVPLGLDVVVASNGPDLQFTNNYAIPIVIYVQLLPKFIQITLYGPSSTKNIALRSHVEEVLKPKTVYQTNLALRDGQTRLSVQGLQGYRVRIRKVVSGLSGKALGNQDWVAYYPPQNRILQIGYGGTIDK